MTNKTTLIDAIQKLTPGGGGLDIYYFKRKIGTLFLQSHEDRHQPQRTLVFEANWSMLEKHPCDKPRTRLGKFFEEWESRPPAGLIYTPIPGAVNYIENIAKEIGWPLLKQTRQMGFWMGRYFWNYYNNSKDHYSDKTIQKIEKRIRKWEAKRAH